MIHDNLVLSLLERIDISLCQWPTSKFFWITYLVGKRLNFDFMVLWLSCNIWYIYIYIWISCWILFCRSYLHWKSPRCPTNISPDTWGPEFWILGGWDSVGKKPPKTFPKTWKTAQQLFISINKKNPNTNHSCLQKMVCFNKHLVFVGLPRLPDQETMCGIEGSVLSEMFSDEFIHEIPRYLAIFSAHGGRKRWLFEVNRWFGGVTGIHSIKLLSFQAGTRP